MTSPTLPRHGMDVPDILAAEALERRGWAGVACFGGEGTAQTCAEASIGGGIQETLRWVRGGGPRLNGPTDCLCSEEPTGFDSRQ